MWKRDRIHGEACRLFFTTDIHMKLGGGGKPFDPTLRLMIPEYFFIAGEDERYCSTMSIVVSCIHNHDILYYDRERHSRRHSELTY